MLLILTCTVNVNSSFTKLVDREERIRQYLDSILFYINHSLFTDIVICENSLFDFSTYNLYELAKSNNKRIETLSFKSNYDLIKEKGKGYGEGEIMKWVFEKSNLLKEHQGFFKITGRLKIKNINIILRSFLQQKNQFQQSRKKIISKKNALDTRIYYCLIETFRKHFLNAYELVNDNNGYYLESCYYDVMARNNIHKSPFKHYPNVSGISGTWNTPYDIPYHKYILYYLVNYFDYLQSRLYILLN